MLNVHITRAAARSGEVPTLVILLETFHRTDIVASNISMAGTGYTAYQHNAY